MMDATKPSSDTNVVTSSWVADLRRKNPLDHAGRSASVLARMQMEGERLSESLCPQCGEALHLCVGDEVAPYLSHASSDSEHRCPGSFETVWHLAAKRAIERLNGWVSERRYLVGGRSFRADAINESSGECVEFVHTLSKDYEAKHVATKNSGRIVSWLFDGNAPFCRRLDDSPSSLNGKLMMRFDPEYANAGQLVARDCLRRKARQLVSRLGPEFCFLHFHGIAFRCIECDESGSDRWEVCDTSSLFASVVYGDGGLNDELIRARASGSDVVHRGLGTNHSPDPQAVVDQVRRWGWLLDVRRGEKAAATSLDHAKSSSAKQGRWVPPEEWPGELVNLPAACRCGSLFGVDVPIHGGMSFRRDCAQCGRFLAFTVWYGE